MNTEEQPSEVQLTTYRVGKGGRKWENNTVSSSWVMPQANHLHHFSWRHWANNECRMLSKLLRSQEFKFGPLSLLLSIQSLNFYRVWYCMEVVQQLYPESPWSYIHCFFNHQT